MPNQISTGKSQGQLGKTRPIVSSRLKRWPSGYDGFDPSRFVVRILCSAKGVALMSKPGAAPQDYGIPKTPALKARFIPAALSFYRQLLREHGIDFDERYVWD
jgi:hypothetical protein